MQIAYSKNAAKALQHMEKKDRQRIGIAIQGLTLSPPKGDIKKMEGKPEGRYRLRVGGYRVIYRYDGSGNMIILTILAIGSRGDIYQ